MAISMYLSITDLNVNGLNSSIKGIEQRIDFFFKKRPIYILPTKDSLQIYRHRLKVKGWKKIFHENEKQKKAGLILLDKQSEKKTVTRGKESHYVMIKRSIQ